MPLTEQHVLMPVCGEPGITSGLPPILLPNGGESALMTHNVDMQMLAALSGRERTLDEFKRCVGRRRCPR